MTKKDPPDRLRHLAMMELILKADCVNPEPPASREEGSRVSPEKDARSARPMNRDEFDELQELAMSTAWATCAAHGPKDPGANVMLRCQVELAIRDNLEAWWVSHHLGG